MDHAFYSQIKNENLDFGDEQPRPAQMLGFPGAQFWAWRWPKGQNQNGLCVPPQVLCDSVVISAQWVRAKNRMRKWLKWRPDYVL